MSLRDVVVVYLLLKIHYNGFCKPFHRPPEDWRSECVLLDTIYYILRLKNGIYQ